MRRRQDDLDVIVGRCCDERCRRQRDAGSSSDGVGVVVGVVVGGSRGRGRPCFGVGEVG
jgi:hypothetical protein